MELNHPFYIYPRGPMSEYNNYSKYRKEVFRLFRFLSNLHADLIDGKYFETKLLIPLILGSTMEDSICGLHSSIKNFFQFRQLFPNYIGNFIKTFSGEKKHIQIIIISPDNLFEQDNYYPLFTTYDSRYVFKKINLYEFELVNVLNVCGEESKQSDISTTELSIKINIFNCPFPSVETRTSLIDKCDNLIKSINTSVNSYGIETFYQTEQDIRFIGEFEQLVGMIFSLNDYKNLFVITNSLVSFKNLDECYKEYSMFKSLLRICNEYNIIATEWDYIDEFICYKVVSSFHFGNKIYSDTFVEYVSDDEYLNIDSLDNNIIKKNILLTKYSKIFHIDFSKDDLMKKFNFY